MRPLLAGFRLAARGFAACAGVLVALAMGLRWGGVALAMLPAAAGALLALAATAILASHPARRRWTGALQMALAAGVALAVVRLVAIDVPDTALDLGLLAVAGALSASARPWAVRAGQLLAALALVLSWLAVVGFASQVKGFFGLAAYIRMDLLTMLATDLACLALLCARPDRGFMAYVSSDGAAAVMVRRLLPATIAVPLSVGWLALVGHRAHLFNATFGTALTAVASVLPLTLLLVLTYRAIDRADQRQLRLQAVLLEEAERRNLARELHDEIGQSLTALKLRLAAPGREARQTAAALVDELMARVRSLSLDLRPPMLDDLGLLPAVLWLVERHRAETGVAVRLEHQGVAGRFPAALETCAFRVVQEALTNVARHAGTLGAVVRLWSGSGTLGAQVEDAGRGFAVEAALAAGRSSGLRGMRERALALGGQVVVESAPQSGARVTLELPLAGGGEEAIRCW
jgi:signal transduction histidine kinase